MLGFFDDPSCQLVVLYVELLAALDVALDITSSSSPQLF